MDANATSVRVAREQYFAANGFSDATYREAWAMVKLGPVPVMFPNTKSRKRALPLHDLHHIATGYRTTVIGENEIAAFEIAGGCGRYPAAWLINAAGFAMGLVLAPARMYKAFVRGRHSRNLYRDGWSDSLLEMSVGELKKRVGTEHAARATWRDMAAFAPWCLIAAAPLSWLAVAILLARSA